MLEETGFNISKLINHNEYIEAMIHDHFIRLYIIGYIPRDTKFIPRTRNEIKSCEWFSVVDLPANKKDMTPKVKMGISPNAFFMIMPFVKRMKRWISERNVKVFMNSTKRPRHKSMGDLESLTSKSKNNSSQTIEKELEDYKQHKENSKSNKELNYQHDNSNHHQNNHHNLSNQPSTSKSTTNNARKVAKHSKRQLFTPQNIQASSSPIQKEDSPKKTKEPGPAEPDPDDPYGAFNFIVPAWNNFKFDRAAILACFD